MFFLLKCANSVIYIFNIDSNNPKQDIAHLVEFVTQLKHLQICGSSQHFETSNIIPNDLSYELSMFKFVQILEVSLILL